MNGQGHMNTMSTVPIYGKKKINIVLLNYLEAINHWGSKSTKVPTIMILK